MVAALPHQAVAVLSARRPTKHHPWSRPCALEFPRKPDDRGKVFQAGGKGMAKIMAQGQLLPDGRLIRLDNVTPPGRVLVQIVIEDDSSGYQLPVGAKAYAVVYSDSWKPIAIIRKMLLRVMSWENYLFSIVS